MEHPQIKMLSTASSKAMLAFIPLLHLVWGSFTWQAYVWYCRLLEASQEGLSGDFQPLSSNRHLHHPPLVCNNINTHQMPQSRMKTVLKDLRKVIRQALQIKAESLSEPSNRGDYQKKSSLEKGKRVQTVHSSQSI